MAYNYMADPSTRQHVDKRTARIDNRVDFIAHIADYKKRQRLAVEVGRELVLIYSHFNCDKVDMVQELLFKYKGKEEDLLANVRAKYGVTSGDFMPKTQLDDNDGSSLAPIPDKPIAICARKRPLFDAERQKGEYDVVSCGDAADDNALTVHNATMRPDMKRMYLKNHRFAGFDRVFDQGAETRQVYRSAVQPLLGRAMNGGISTLLMFGQTGSGKTHTTSGIQELLSADIFRGHGSNNP